ncbi:hypothetical protein GCM10027614_06820 [Micromonospora vulcania]
MVERELDYLAREPEVVRLAGIVDGRTVATATVSLNSDVAGVFCVATDSGHRRRGIGTALTVAALRLARMAGHRVATLQASGAGRPVYERIGFETVSHYRLFRFPSATEA